MVNTGLCQGKEKHNTRWLSLATRQVQQSNAHCCLAPVETQGSSLNEESVGPNHSPTAALQKKKKEEIKASAVAREKSLSAFLNTSFKRTATTFQERLQQFSQLELGRNKDRKGKGSHFIST